jgi:hypothetical protein
VSCRVPCAHRLRVVRAMPARGTVIAANAAAGRSHQRAERYRAEDGRRKREGMGRCGDSCSVCCAREMVPVLFAVRGRPRFRAVAGVGAEERRGARGGDEGGVGDGECALHLLRAPAMLRVVFPVPDTSWLRAEDNQALDTVATGREVITVARGMGSGCCRCWARGGSCVQAPCARVNRGEWYLLEMHLAGEEAIKAAPAMGNDHRTRCARRRR